MMEANEQSNLIEQINSLKNRVNLLENQPVKRVLSSAPTFTPKNFSEQIQVVTGGELWVYIDGTWKEFNPV